MLEMPDMATSIALVWVALAFPEPQTLPGPSYTAGEVLTFFAAAGVLITGVGAVIVNIIVALKTGAKIDEASKKTDGLAAKVAEVHNLTNSGLSAVKAELAMSNALNIQLRDIIADLKEERGKTALASAFKTQAVPTGVDDDPPEGVSEQLEQIEVNTAETAANTKQTEQSTKRTEQATKRTETAIDKLPKK